MADKVKIGVIGCGARMVLGILRFLFKATDRVEVAALCDPDPEAVKRTRESYNPEAAVYDDYRTLVKDPHLSWVLVGSWNCCHAAHAIAALEAGKHVFCEKPLATTIKDCLAMQRAWRQSGRMFSLGFTLRYSPYYRQAYERIASGGLGQVISLEANEALPFGHGACCGTGWRRKEANSGGHLLEKCCHDIDLMNWMAGSLPVRTASFGGRNLFVPENARLYEPLVRDVKSPATLGKTRTEWRDYLLKVNPFTNDQDLVDNQVVIFEYANQVRATFHLSRSAGIPERRMYILGTEGAIRLNIWAEVMEYCRTSLRNMLDKDEVENMFLQLKQDVHGHAGGDRVLGEELAASILQGRPPAADLNDGLRSAVACLAAEESRRSGTIVDLRPYWREAEIKI